MSRQSECEYCGSACARGKTICRECAEWEATNSDLGLQFAEYTETEAQEARDKFCLLMTWELQRRPVVLN